MYYLFQLQERELETNFKTIQKDCEKKKSKVETLETHQKELVQHIEDLNKELENKTEEIKHFKKKTDEYIKYVLWRHFKAFSRNVLFVILAGNENISRFRLTTGRYLLLNRNTKANFRVLRRGKRA